MRSGLDLRLLREKISLGRSRGTIAGQIKAMAMIVAIEGLVPDRRLSPSATQPAAPPINADIYTSEWLRKQQHQAAAEEPDPVAAAETRPAAPHVPEPEPAPEPAPAPANDASSLNRDRNQPSLSNPFINPVTTNWVPEATGYVFDAVLDRGGPLRLPVSPNKRFSGRRR